MYDSAMKIVFEQIGLRYRSLFLLLAVGAMAGLLWRISPAMGIGFFLFALLFIIALRNFHMGILILILGSAVIATKWPLYRYSFAHFHFAHLLMIILPLVSFIEVLEQKSLKSIYAAIDAPLVLMFLAAVLAVLNSYIFGDPEVPLTHRHLIVQVTGLTLILFPISIFISI